MKLKPCPHCGTPNPKLIATNHVGAPWSHVGLDAIGVAVVCGKCGATQPSMMKADDAAAAWNERAPLGEREPSCVYIVETYDELLEGPFVEPACYADKAAAVRRVQSQTYTDGEGVRHWADFEELRVVERMAES